jgi:hypothetical protein
VIVVASVLMATLKLAGDLQGHLGRVLAADGTCRLR